MVLNVTVLLWRGEWQSGNSSSASRTEDFKLLAASYYFLDVDYRYRAAV